VLTRIAELPRLSEPGVRWVPAAHWHVTLRFLGDADAERVVSALEEVSAAVRPGRPIEAVMGPEVARLGRQVICLPVSGLEALAALVSRATADVGEPVDPRPFRGHLTLARLRHRGACGLSGHALQATFAVREMELVSSVLGRSGARHELVRAFSLAP
jgi:RNA 2',3'-cyclic 3'-phosphodiesterase